MVWRREPQTPVRYAIRVSCAGQMNSEERQTCGLLNLILKPIESGFQHKRDQLGPFT